MLAFILPGNMEWLTLLTVFLIVCFWRILNKVGYNPWLSLLCIIPPVPLVLIGVLAFRKWPSAEMSQ